jgi:Sulfotransferase domain
MLGEALGVPCRDIYVQPGFSLFDIGKHPWYAGTEGVEIPRSCVIKSHELPESPAIDFDATMIHLVRDGRDVIVSKFFFDTEFCVRNGILENVDVNFDEYVERTAFEWSHYVTSWSEVHNLITVRYEDFLLDPVGALGQLLTKQLGVSFDTEYLTGAVNKFTKAKFSASLDAAFAHNTFVRKGVAGDWVNHFSDKNRQVYEALAGQAHKALGYQF